MKVRRMCGGGSRRSSARELRYLTSSSNAWAVVHDRTGLVLVLRDPADDWPAQPWSVIRQQWSARAYNAADEARRALLRARCAVRGHDPVDDGQVVYCGSCGCDPS